MDSGQFEQELEQIMDLFRSVKITDKQKLLKLGQPLIAALERVIPLLTMQPSSTALLAAIRDFGLGEYPRREILINQNSTILHLVSGEYDYAKIQQATHN